MLQTAESCRKLGAPEAHVFSADLTDGKQLADLVKQLEAKFQMVNVLVNNAGAPGIVLSSVATCILVLHMPKLYQGCTRWDWSSKQSFVSALQ